MGGKSTLVLAAAFTSTVVICVAALVSMSGIDERDRVARLLPSNTIAYASANDLPKLLGAIESGGLRQELMNEIGSAAALSEEDRQSLDDTIHKLTALHLSIHDVRLEAGRVEVDALLVAEGGLTGEPTQWLPPSVRKLFKEQGTIQGARLYVLEKEDLQEPGRSILMAGAEGAVFFATDRDLLDGVLAAALRSRRRSLARSREYRRMVKGVGRHDVQIYVSAVEVANRLEQAGSAEGKEGEPGEGERFLSTEDFRGLKSLCFGMDFDGQRAALRLRIAPESVLFRLLAQPAIERKLPDSLPASTVLFLGGSAGDGTATWEAFHNYFASELVRAGQVAHREQYDDRLAELEQKAGIDFREAVALLGAETGVFFDGELDPEAMCLSVQVKSEEKAGEIVARFAEATSEGEIVQEEAGGVRISVAGGDGGTFAWAVRDGRLMLAPGAAPIKASIEAEEDTLAASEAYRDITELLPPRSACLAYVSVAPLLRGLGLDLEGAESLEGLAVAVSMTAARGVIDVRAAHNRTPAEGVEPVIVSALRLALAQARRVRLGEALDGLGAIHSEERVYRAEHDAYVPVKAGQIRDYPTYDGPVLGLDFSASDYFDGAAFSVALDAQWGFVATCDGALSTAPQAARVAHIKVQMRGDGAVRFDLGEGYSDWE